MDMFKDLNYEKYLEDGDHRISSIEDYNSHNTQRLNIDEMKSMLLKLDYISAVISGTNYDPDHW